MHKKIMILLAIIVILAMVIGLSTVLSSSALQNNYPISQSLLASAINQTDPETEGGSVGRLLDKAVEKGLIEESEAIEIIEWLQNKPEILIKLPPGKCIATYIAGNDFSLLSGEIAAILERDELQVTEAMQQARREIQNEAVLRLLDKAVLKNKIDQSQADEIYSWWMDRPVALNKIGIGMCMPRGAGRVFISKVAAKLCVTEAQLIDAVQQARQQIQGQAVDRLLNRAVGNGRITEDEAVKIREWWNNQPEGLDKLRLGRYFRMHRN